MYKIEDIKSVQMYIMSVSIEANVEERLWTQK